MLNELKKMRRLQHLRIEGAWLKASVVCNLGKSVHTLELIDCSSERWLRRTMRKITGLRTIHITDPETTNLQCPCQLNYQKYFAYVKTCVLNGYDYHSYVLKDMLPNSVEEFDISRWNNQQLRGTMLLGVLSIIIHVGIFWPQLKVFRVGGRRDITDFIVDKICVCNQSLRELHLNYCSHLTDAALSRIPDMHNLTRLNLSD